MNAQDLPVTQLLDGAKQFIVPIFQSTKHCQQLWADIMHVGPGANAKWHFLDAVVYVAAEENTAGITRWLLIDGQQLMKTLTLLLVALRDRMIELQGIGKNSGEDAPTPEEFDGKGILDAASARVKENFSFLRDLVSQSDVQAVDAAFKALGME